MSEYYDAVMAYLDTSAKFLEKALIESGVKDARITVDDCPENEVEDCIGLLISFGQYYKSIVIWSVGDPFDGVFMTWVVTLIELIKRALMSPGFQPRLLISWMNDCINGANETVPMQQLRLASHN